MTDQAQQRTQALEHANRARLAGSELRSQIRAAGCRGGAELAARSILTADAPMAFYRLLTSIPRIGPTPAIRWLAVAHINPEARVNDPRVDRRRREVLAGELLRWAHA